MNHLAQISRNSYVYHFKDPVKANTILIFGYPCAQWWKKTMEVITSLDFFQQGKLSFRHFFIGKEMFPLNLFLDLLDTICDDECSNKHHPCEELMDLSYPIDLKQDQHGESLLGALITKWESLGVILEKDGADTDTTPLTEILYEIVKKLSLDEVKCIHFDFYRSLCDLKIVSGKVQFLPKVVEDVFEELYIGMSFPLEGLDNDLIFQKLADIWSRQRPFWQHCTVLFSFLDSMEPHSVMNIGHKRWLHDVIYAPKLIIRERILELVRMRFVSALNQCSLKTITTMLMDIGELVYVDLFEKPLLECVSARFNFLNQCLLGVKNPEELSSVIDDVLMDEALLGHTRSRLISLLSEHLMDQRTPWMRAHVLRGLDRVLVDEKLQDLSLSYDLIVRWSHCHRTSIVSSFEEVMCALSKDQEKNNFQYISDVLLAVDNCKEIISTSLRNNPDTLNDIHKSVGLHLQSRKDNPEHLSLFVDAKLREAAAGNDINDIESVLDKVTVLIRFSCGICMFQQYYMKHLSRRIVFGTFTLEAEERMLFKLKDVCELDFINICKRMLLDYVNSPRMMGTFRSALSPEDALGSSIISVSMFDSGCWPRDKRYGRVVDFKSCQLPPEIAKVAGQFEAFYKTHEDFARRKIIWKTNEGNAVLEFDNGSSMYECLVSTYQMCILSLFNTSDSLSFYDIQSATDIPASDLEVEIRSLCKSKLLVSSDSAISVNSIFSVNANFRHSSQEVQICDIAPVKESESEREVTSEIAKENRNPAIDAAIVRILKSQRKLSHRKLLDEVVIDLQKYFEPVLVDIRKRIEALIESESIARVGNDAYSYVTL